MAGFLPEDFSTASEMADLQRRVRALEMSPRLQNASIGAGGLTVRDGGAIRILDQGGEPRVVLDTDGLAVDGGEVVAVHADVGEQPGTGNQSLTTTFLKYATLTFTVPPWVETARVLCWGYGQMSNSSGGAQTLLVSARVNDVDDGAATQSIVNGTGGMCLHIDEQTVATPGPTLTCSVWMRVGVGTNSANQGSVWGLLIGHAT